MAIEFISLNEKQDYQILEDYLTQAIQEMENKIQLEEAQKIQLEVDKEMLKAMKIPKEHL